MGEPETLTPRQQAHRATTEEIKRIARRHLATHGADGLSLRAVARDLGVVSSAVYRYVASRDELLTLLIVDAFEAVGTAAEAAAGDRADGFRARWGRVNRAVRAWAVGHPHDYALVYGSPVPGYQAPTDTVDPALRVSVAALRVVADGVADGQVVGRPGDRAAGAVHDDFARIGEALGLDLPDDVASRTLVAWTGLFGHISYVLFGHLANGITDEDAFFEDQLARWTDLVAGPPLA